MLVPGGAADSTTLFANAFDVLVQVLNPSLDEAGRDALASGLGITATTPPFASGTNTVRPSPPLRFQALTRQTTSHGEISAISVVDGRGR